MSKSLNYNFICMIDAQVSKTQSRQEDEGWNYPGTSLTSHIKIRRNSNRSRVQILPAPPPSHITTKNFFIDGKRIGGYYGISDGMSIPFLSSDEFQSNLCILHENGFTWDEITKFHWIVSFNRNHLQFRQIELIHELTSNIDAAKFFYGSLYKGIDELAQEFTNAGIDISSIFLAGGSALLLDPAHFPLQTNPRARIANRMNKPKEKLKTEELAETLSDVDIVVFGYRNGNHNDDLSTILGRSYGTIFTPLGFEPQKVIDSFPDRIGLDVILCQEDDLAGLVASAEVIPDGKVSVDLIRYPNIHRPAQSRLAPGLITEMIPLWWNPKDADKKEKYYAALKHVRQTGNLAKLLQSCSEASKARETLYADKGVKTALQRRWDMIRDGESVEELFRIMFRQTEKGK